MSELSLQTLTESSSRTKELALEYARLGWPILPLHTPTPENGCSCRVATCDSIGKHPRTRNGSKDATNDVASVRRWWEMWPEANIGIATGQKSNLVVIDVDPRHGGDKSWTEWCNQNDLPETLKSLTGGGGFHLYFTTNEPTKNRVNVLPGVDVRGEDGYIVAPGSIHASQQRYRWESDVSKIKPALLPEVLKNLILQQHKSSTIIRIHGDSIPCGTRNATLASIAGVLRRQGLEEKGIVHALSILNQSACSSPLDSAEVAAIAKSISRYENNRETEIIWKEPRPLPSLETSVPLLSENLVPERLRRWITDIADRMQVPLEFIAAPVVVSLSSVIGRQIGIFPKREDNWLVVPNLWGAVIARPGFFKSPAISEGMKPLDYLTKEAQFHFESGKVAVKAKEEMLRAKIDGLKDTIKKATRKGNGHDLGHLQADLETALREIESNVIFEKRFKTNDATVEKLACLLKENPKGMLVLRDELSGWLKSLQKSGREGDREFYLEAWNGYGSFTVDRIGRGTLHVPALCLSIFGGLQPGKIDSYLNQTSGGQGDDGLLQRFQILVYPDSPKKWRNVDRKPDQEAFEEAKNVFERVAQLRIKNPEASDHLPGLHFSKDAQEQFNEWREKLETRLRSGEPSAPAFESHLAKYRSLVPSLALIFHLVTNSKNKSIEVTDKVGLESLSLAIRWTSFLEAHARKVYEYILNPNLSAAHSLAKKITSKSVSDNDSVRSIYNNNWSRLDTSERVDLAISVLEEANWVQVETIRGGGRPTERIRINSAVFDPKFQSNIRVPSRVSR